MTYFLNGVPFDNSDFEWVHRGTSRPLADLAVSLEAVQQRGRHGVLSPMPGVLDAPMLRFVIRTPRAHLRTLEAIVRAGGVLTSTYELGESVVEFVSLTPTGFGDADANVDLAVTFRVPAGVARGPVSTSPRVTLSASNLSVVGLFAGLSAEVQDALVRFEGPTSDVDVIDTAGSWFVYAGTISSGEYLRFEAATGRAFITGSDVWTGGVEVSGNVDFDGPRGRFEITPTWSGDPSSRDGRLRVITAGASAGAFQVRGRGAYLI